LNRTRDVDSAACYRETCLSLSVLVEALRRRAASGNAASALRPSIQVRKYLDQEAHINTATPNFDKCVSFQFEKAEDREIIYFAIGRCLTTIGDHFDFMIMLYGEGGTGKSLIQQLIKYSFGGSQVGYLSNSLHDRFGLSEFADKQIVCCDDMPRNMSKVLPRSDFLSMMSRGAISCPVKGKQSIEVDDWNIPTVINSNQMPNYRDESGEIIRRMLMINFNKLIPKDLCDTELESKIKSTNMALSCTNADRRISD
jgi:phage/plasmid-associated DNA primase